MQISEILDQFQIDYRRAGETRHVREGWLGVVCPWCDTGQGNYGLGIHLESQACTCWKCGKHSLAHYLLQVTQAQPQEIYKLLRDREWILPKKATTKGKLVLPEGLGDLLPQQRDYLQKRGFDPDEICELWGVRGIGLASRLQFRLFIPIYLDNSIVSWTTRSIAPDCVIRYINAGTGEESFPRRKCLYGANNAKETAIVVEGPTDVWAIGPGAVATMGLMYSKAQVRAISAFSTRVICFDREPAAQRRANSLCEQLDCLPGETYRVVLSGKDPASSPRSELRELRRRFL